MEVVAKSIQEIEENKGVEIFTQYKQKTTKRSFFKNSGAEGFEPPNAWTKTRCLTAWLRPIIASLTLL